jgi:hypothetical protein
MLLFFCKPVIVKHQIPISIVNIITYDLTDNIGNCYSTVTDKIQFQMLSTSHNISFYIL